MSSLELIKPEFISLYDLIAKRRFLVPFYQRPYSWDAPEVISLLNDIEKNYNNYNDNLIYDKNSKLYVGNVVIQQAEIDALFNVIDGQQRITTFALILLSINNLLKQNCEITNDDLSKLLWYEIHQTLNKEKRLITLGSSIDKDVLVKLFDISFDYPAEAYDKICKIEVTNKYAKRIINNYITIHEWISKKHCSLGELKRFKEFVLNQLSLICITIDSAQPISRAIDIFDSINSKGMQLQEIDSIKTFIFSFLKEDKYQKYLDKWGELILKTNDNVYLYLNVFIKSYIEWKKGLYSYKDFKDLKEKFHAFFNTFDDSEVFEQLINNMLDDVDCFNALFDYKLAKHFVNNSKLNFYYLLFTHYGFKHLYPMFYKCFKIFKNFNNGKQTVFKPSENVDVLIESIKISIIWTKIIGKDSDDLGDTMLYIADNYIDLYQINKEMIINDLYKLIHKNKIDSKAIYNSLYWKDLYSNDKKLLCGIISLFRFSDNQTNNIAWNESSIYITNHGSGLDLDHLLARNPGYNDIRYSYYKLNDKSGGNLCLKKNHDFFEKDSDGKNIVYNDMPYKEFEISTLNRLGNFKIKGSDENRQRGNASLIEFATFDNLIKRNEKIVKFCCENIFNLIKNNDNLISDNPIITENINCFNIFSDQKLKAVGIKFEDDDEMKPCPNWTDIERQIFKKAFSFDNDKLIELAKNGFPENQRVIFSSDEEFSNDNKPICLLNNAIYLKKISNPQTLIRICRDLLSEINFDSSKIEIFYRKK